MPELALSCDGQSILLLFVVDLVRVFPLPALKNNWSYVLSKKTLKVGLVGFGFGLI